VIDEIVEEMARDGEGPLVVRTNAAVVGQSKADQAARDIQRASSELWALYEVAQTLSSSLGLQETLEILARKLEAILPGTACLFLLRDGDTQDLVVRTATGINQLFFNNARTFNDQSITRRVVEQRQTFLGEYDPDDILVASCPTDHWTPISTALIVSIVHQGETLGTINVYHPCANAFSEHDVQLLEMIAERAALALYNGLLFDRTRSQAFTDPLTGLHNVRYLTKFVDETCQKLEDERAARQADSDPLALAGSIDGTVEGRGEDAFALLCLDLDSFKPINDNFGHQKGDHVLRDLSSIFKSLVRSNDVVARYGGDEFLIVILGAGDDEAQQMMDRIKTAVESYDPELMHPKLGALRLGVSVGYACYPVQGRDCATLLSVADARMYEDKTERKLGRLIDRTAEKPDLVLHVASQLEESPTVEIPKAA
jgi:diguanylate cyclase (GGDEF)-like protein